MRRSFYHHGLFFYSRNHEPRVQVGTPQPRQCGGKPAVPLQFAGCIACMHGGCSCLGLGGWEWGGQRAIFRAGGRPTR
jgi:hypothetical protein